MIKHIVMLRVKDPEDNVFTIKENLEKLKTMIPEIIELKVGININHSERKSDLVLETIFENTDTLDHYQNHPQHQEVVRFINQHKTESRVVDYEY